MYYVVYITGIIEIVINKYFELKNTCTCTNSNYLLSSVASKDTTTCYVKAIPQHICAHTASTSTQLHSGMGTQTQTDCACIVLSLNSSSFEVVPNNLASHAHVPLPSHIVFLRFNT